MIGALEADLIAWTFEHDLESYSKGMVSPKADLSLHGRMIQYFMNCASLLSIDTKPLFHAVIHQLELDIADGFVVSDSITHYLQSDYNGIPEDLKMAMWPAAYICCGYYAQDTQQAQYLAHQWFNQLHLGKQGYYSAYLAELIYELKQGNLPLYHTSHLYHDFILGRYVKCFIDTKCFHDAVDMALHIEGYRHHNAIVVGAMAYAFYKNK